MAFIAESPCPYKILTGQPSGTIGGDEGGWGETVGFWVGEGVGGEASDLLPFLQFVGGTPETITVGGVTTERIVPLRDPYFPDMVAQRVRVDRTGRGIATTPGWTDAKVWVDFALVPYDFAGDQPYLTLRRRYGASAITLPGQAYAVSSVRLNHDVAIAMPEILYSATAYNVPSRDDSVYKVLMGKVNSDVFLGFDAETVRFDGVEDEIVKTIAFTTNRTVSLSLAWRPRSWNQVLLPSGVWATPLNVNDGSKLYTPAVFAPLLF